MSHGRQRRPRPEHERPVLPAGARRTAADDYIWAIQNGSSGLSGANPGDPGSLYKLVEDGSSGKWGPAPGWEIGRAGPLPERPTGEPDSEGVTAVDGKVYVASERDNTNGDVSKISVLEVDPNSIVPKGGTQDGRPRRRDGDLAPPTSGTSGRTSAPTRARTRRPGSTRPTPATRTWASRASRSSRTRT